MKKLASYIFSLAAVAAVSASIVIVNRPADPPADESRLLELARRAFPEASDVRHGSEDQADFVWVMDGDGEHLGAVVLSSPHTDHITGYAGPVPLLIAVGPEGDIVKVELLENVETSSYVRRLLDSDFMERWRGMSWQQAASETGYVDAISMVTITADAIVETLRHRLSLMDPEAAVAPPRRLWPEAGLSDAAIILVVLTGTIVALLPVRLPRWTVSAQLTLTLLVLGVATTSMLSMALVGGWLLGGTFSGPVGLLFLAAMALLLPIISRKNVYCHFVCPFGAAQTLLHKVTRRRLKIPRAAHRPLKYVRYGLLTIVAASLLVGFALDPNDLEPFSAFRPQAAGIAALSIAMVSLLLAPVTSRPWCTYGCGTGALLDLLKRPVVVKKGTAGVNEKARVSE